jgi:hypothetical protein
MTNIIYRALTPTEAIHLILEKKSGISYRSNEFGAMWRSDVENLSIKEIGSGKFVFSQVIEPKSLTVNALVTDMVVESYGPRYLLIPVPQDWPVGTKINVVCTEVVD